MFRSLRSQEKKRCEYRYGKVCSFIFGHRFFLGGGQGRHMPSVTEVGRRKGSWI